jgi:hypothetical protein
VFGLEFDGLHQSHPNALRLPRRMHHDLHDLGTMRAVGTPAQIKLRRPDHFRAISSHQQHTQCTLERPHNIEPVCGGLLARDGRHEAHRPTSVDYSLQQRGELWHEGSSLVCVKTFNQHDQTLDWLVLDSLMLDWLMLDWLMLDWLMLD